MDINAHGKQHFKREILGFFATRGETNYAEEEVQFARDVLRATLPDGSRAYYNGTINNRHFARTEASRQLSRDTVLKAVKTWWEGKSA